MYQESIDYYGYFFTFIVIIVMSFYFHDYVSKNKRFCCSDCLFFFLKNHFLSWLATFVPLHLEQFEVCPPAERCTSVQSFSDSCALEISPVCISNGELQAGSKVS